jgi:SAM-dependent methyltransferase
MTGSQSAASEAGAKLRAQLKALHQDVAGFTEACAAACVDGRGRNSYAWICDGIDPPAGGHVLDLACGSGVLLDLIRKRFGPALALSGVDMSPAELALARERLVGANVALHEGVAQSLSFAADDSFDAVLCHWALTLMDPLDPVLAEISRILKPGGVFTAIVDGPVQAAPSYGRVAALIDARVKAADPNHGEMGDPRARTADTLLRLAQDGFKGAACRVETEVFALQAEPDTLAREASGFFYSAYALKGAARQAMLDDLTDFFAGMAVPRYEMPVNRLRVVTPAAA